MASVRVNLGQAPRILVHPQGQSLALGQLLSLTVSASGTGPLIFRWYGLAGILSNGGRVSGATATNLNIATFQAADAGDYYVSVANAFGTTNSASVRVR